MNIDVFQVAELSRQVRVDSRGEISKGEARDPVIKADDIIIVYEDDGKALTHGLAQTLRGLIHIRGTVPQF